MEGGRWKAEDERQEDERQEKYGSCENVRGTNEIKEL